MQQVLSRKPLMLLTYCMCLRALQKATGAICELRKIHVTIPFSAI